MINKYWYGFHKNQLMSLSRFLYHKIRKNKSIPLGLKYAIKFTYR